MTTVKVDKEVLAATVIALDAFAADLPGLFSRAAGLGARTEMAGLNGSGQWATDTARDLRGRIGVLEAMNQANPTFGGVRMDGADALAIAGQTMTVEDALVTLRTAGAPANAWEDTDPANLQEWFHELQAEALDRLADLNDEGQAEALVAAYHDLQNLVVGSSAAVSTMTYLVTQGGPALAQWLAQRQIVQPALARAAASSPGVANWLSGALRMADDAYLRGQTQFRYPGAWVPNMTQKALLQVAGVTEDFTTWVNRMSSATRPYLLPGETTPSPTALARFLQSAPGQSARGWVERMLTTTSAGQLTQRLAGWGNTVFGRPWTHPVTGQVFGRGAGNLATMARTSGWSTMARSAGALRLGGVATSAIMTVDGTVGLWNNREEHAEQWAEGGTEGRAHVIGEYAETAFNATMTAALIAPNPVTIGLVAVTGVVWAGAEIVEHWDDIEAAAEEAVDWVGDRAEDAGEWVGDRVDDIKESDLNPMNWF